MLGLRSRLAFVSFALALTSAGCKRGSPLSSTVADSPTPCAEMMRLVSSLDKPMTADLYVTRGTPSTDAYADKVGGLLRAYEAGSKGHFQFHVIDARNDKDKARAKELGLVQHYLGPGSGDAWAQGYLGIAFTYAGETDTMPSLTPPSTTATGDWSQFWVANKMRELRDKGDHVKRRVGILTGHGEAGISTPNLVPDRSATKGTSGPNLRSILAQNFSFYEFVDVDLQGGDAPVDGALQGLIVTQPTTDLTDKELRAIDQYVMKGRALVVFASSVNVAAGDTKMHASLGAHGLDRLMRGYGIELGRDVVLDGGDAFVTKLPTAAGIGTVTLPQLLHVAPDPKLTGDAARLDSSFIPFLRSDGIYFPFASSLTLHKETQPQAKTMRVVARSSKSAWRETDAMDLSPDSRVHAPSGALRSYDLAATVEGTLASAFPTGDDLGIKTPAVSVAPARVFVAASSELLANPFAVAMPKPAPPSPDNDELETLGQRYAGGGALTSTVLFFKNTLDWLTDDAGLAGCGASGATTGGQSR